MPSVPLGTRQGDSSFTPRRYVELIDVLLDGIDTDPCWHPGSHVAPYVKADPSTRWFARVWRADCRAWPSSRLRFDGYGGGKAAPFASVFAFWNVDVRLVKAAFEGLGHVEP